LGSIIPLFIIKIWSNAAQKFYNVVGGPDSKMNTEEREQNLMTRLSSGKELLVSVLLNEAMLHQVSKLGVQVQSEPVLQLAWEPIFEKPYPVQGTNPDPFELIYDNHRSQLVYKRKVQPNRFVTMKKSTKAQKEIIDTLKEIWTGVEDLIETEGGIGGRKLEMFSLLQSKGGGIDQWVHVDYVEKGRDRILLAFIPLASGPHFIG
jgi:hypothetical protein